MSAGRDCVMIWDYNGMDTSFKPFRSFEPFQGCVVCMFSSGNAFHVLLLTDVVTS